MGCHLGSLRYSSRTFQSQIATQCPPIGTPLRSRGLDNNAESRLYILSVRSKTSSVVTCIIIKFLANLWESSAYSRLGYHADVEQRAVCAWARWGRLSAPVTWQRKPIRSGQGRCFPRCSAFKQLWSVSEGARRNAPMCQLIYFWSPRSREPPTPTPTPTPTHTQTPFSEHRET
jgi:hypothetical protein